MTSAVALPEPELQRELQAINHELVSLVAALPAPASVPKPQEAGPVDQETLRALLEQLEALLVQSDTSAIALIDQHINLLTSALGEPGQELIRMVKRFDFESAALLLSLRPKPHDRD